MNQIRKGHVFLSVVVVINAIPGARAAAEHFKADELIWLIPMLPAFTVVFFWMVDTLVRLFIQNDAYKDPAAIKRAESFLRVFGVFFLGVWGFFILAEAFIYGHFRP